MPLTKPEAAITPQVANYLKGKLARPDYRSGADGLQASRGASRGDKTQVECKLKLTTHLDKENDERRAGMRETGHSHRNKVCHCDAHHRCYYCVTRGRQCDVTRIRNCCATDRHLNILPSEISKYPCYLNFLFCTRHLGRTPASQTTPDPSSSARRQLRHLVSLRDNRDVANSSYTYSSNYMKSKDAGVPSSRDASQQTPALQCPLAPHTWIFKKKKKLARKFFPKTKATLLTSILPLRYQPDTQSDRSIDKFSTKCQVGSADRDSDFDDSDGPWFSRDVRSRREFFDAKSSPHEENAEDGAMDSTAPLSGWFATEGDDSSPESSSDQPSSPLYTLKQHDSPSRGAQTCSVLTNTQKPDHSSERRSIFSSQIRDAWKRITNRLKERANVEDYCAESPEESEYFSPQSSESDAERGSNDHAKMTRQADRKGVDDVKQAREEIVGKRVIWAPRKEDESTSEKTSFTVIHESWDPARKYESRLVDVKCIPFTIPRSLEDDAPSKVDKSTMVQMECFEADILKGCVCTGCNLHSQVNIQRLPNHVIIGDYLRRLYIHDQLCDVIIHVGSYTFSAHRLALAAHSKYFANMFLEDSKKPPTEIWLDGHGISSAAFQTILGHIYSMETNITLENVADVYTAAKFLQIQSLQTICEDLQDHFTPDNALIVLDISGCNNSSNDAYQRALAIVTSSFHDVRHSDAFLSLEADRVCEILGSDELAVSSEMEVFQAALLWLKTDAYRMAHMPRVMSCVLFVYMEPDEILLCTTELPGLLEDLKCREIILAAHWFSYSRSRGIPCRVYPTHMPPRRKSLLARTQPPQEPKSANKEKSEELSGDARAHVMTPTASSSPSKEKSSEPPLMGVTQGQDSKGENVGPAKAKHIPKGRPVNISFWETRVQTATEESEDMAQIFLIGGFIPSKEGQDILAPRNMPLFDESTKSWYLDIDGPIPRYHHAGASVDGLYFVVGGSDRIMDDEKADSVAYPTNTVFRCDVFKNATWRQMASMQHKRVHHGAVALDNRIYVIGGQDENQTVLSSVEVYDIKTNSWSTGTPLSEGKLGIGVAALGGLIYVVGGYRDSCEKLSGEPITSTVECFDPSSNRWIQKKPLRTPRCYGSLVAANGKLYLCGGATQSFTLDSSILIGLDDINVYDEDHDSWYTVSRFVAIPRRGAAVAATDTKIFVFGGTSWRKATNGLTSYECYDIRKNKCDLLASNMPYSCVGSTAFVVWS